MRSASQPKGGCSATEPAAKAVVSSTVSSRTMPTPSPYSGNRLKNAPSDTPERAPMTMAIGTANSIEYQDPPSVWVDSCGAMPAPTKIGRAPSVINTPQVRNGTRPRLSRSR